MNGRRIYHARGKVLGGSSSINGMIFQRGNPLDYERWGADPGMGSWDYAHCLPYFKRMESCLAGADEFRGGDGPLVLERGPATSPLFEAFFEAVQQAGYPLTDDVNGFKQEGFAAFDRNIHDGRRLSAARAYLHPVMHRPNLEVRCRAFVNRVLFDGTRAVGVEVAGRTGPERIEAGEVILCGGAINSPQLLQLSGVGNARRARGARDRRRPRPAGRRRAPAGPPRGLHPVRLQAAGLGRARDEVAQPSLGRVQVAVLPLGAGRDEPLRGGRLHPRRRRRRLPEPDVPLPAGRDPLRRLVARGRARLPGARRPDVLGRARLGEDHLEGPARPSGAALQLPLDRAGPARVGRGGARRAHDPHPARVRAVQRRRALAGRRRSRPTRRSSTGSRATRRRRCTRRAPAGWASTSMSVVDPETMRVHGLDGLRVVDASVFPYVTNGNIYAPTMMVAEKAADLILGSTPLPAESTPFYRHQARDAPERWHDVAVSEFAATFDTDPAGYAAGRPGYPPVIFDGCSKSDAGSARAPTVIEIGPGTGQATAELLAARRPRARRRAGPGARRVISWRRIGGEPLEVTVSSFEDGVLPGCRSDLVVAATSFHWVEPEIGTPKVLSVLRPGGSVAIWWNLCYDPRGPDEFSRALDPIFEEFGDVESPAFVDTRQEEYWLPLMQRGGLRRGGRRAVPVGGRADQQRTSSRCSAPSPTCGCGRPPSTRRCSPGLAPWRTISSAGACAGRIRPCSTPGASPAAERQPAWLTLSTALTMPS